MNNPEQKAKELLDKFRNVSMQCDSYNKACALLCVNEIYNVLPDIQETWEYWAEVEIELNKL